MFFCREKKWGDRGLLGREVELPAAYAAISAFPLSFLVKRGVPRRVFPLGGTRARQTPRPVTPLFFAYLLFSQKHEGSKGDIPPWQDKGAASATSCYSAFLCLLAFLTETRGIQGGYSPLTGQGRGKRHVLLLRFSLPTFFSREKREGGIQGGRTPPWRDKAAFGGTSRYFAFLCLLSFLAKRK